MTTKKKCWSKLDEEKRLCLEWLQEPLVNPETGHPIERNGPTYQDWQERCKNIGISHRPRATKIMTWRKCQEWLRNPEINPDTGRKIKKGSATYKWLEKQCKLIQEKEIRLEGDYYLPDKSGMVPCIKFRDTWYVVRKFEDRKIWGPLNKVAKSIKLCYYRDTWDYHYNHYKPIFVDGPPPRRKIDKRPPPRKPTPKQKQQDWLSKTFVRKTEHSPSSNQKGLVDTVVDLFVPRK